MRYRLTVPVLFLLTFFSVITAQGQDFSNKGKDFWLAYPGHIDGNSSRMALYISSTVNTTGTVFLPGGATIPFTVVANQATVVQISPAIYNVINPQSEGTFAGRGIHITSLQPVVVYAHILNQARSGSTLVLPTNTLGREYIATSYKSMANSNPPNGTVNGSNAGSQFTIVGVEENTIVEITPSVGDAGAVRFANIPFTIVLNKGDVYQYRSTYNNDITGTRIRTLSSSTSSCKPIAVFCGSPWTSLDCNNASGGDNLFLQLMPKSAWGKNYVTAPFADRQYDIFRVIVDDPNTVVTRNGVALNQTSLIGGTYYQFTSTSANVITSDKPIMVIQYMISQTCDTRNNGNTGANAPFPGDPEMIIINPIEQTLNDVTVVSARANLTPPNTNITKHFFTIIMKTDALNSLRIDGSPFTGNVTSIGTSGYSYIHENVTASTAANPSHRITADSGFIALAYGMGAVESYGYNAGTNIIDLYQYISLQNQYATVNIPATCIGTPFKFSITLPYQAVKIRWDFNNAANLSPNALVQIDPPVGSSVVPSDSSFVRDGKTLHVYKLETSYNFSSPGTYPIKILVNNPTPDGCSGDQEINYDVVVYPKPLVDWTINSNGCITEAVQFNDATNTSGRTITNWLWEFGDATISNLKNPQKNYTNPGTYNVKLTTITDIGCVADNIKPFSISAPPVAAFHVENPRCEGAAITFSDQSIVSAGANASWHWDFGNGNSVTNTNNASVTQAYDVGTYTAKLIVENLSGCLVSDTATESFVVHPKPVSNFIVPEVCLNDSYAQFLDSSYISDNTESSFTYAWTFGDANATAGNPNTATIKNPTHQYTTLGNYTAQLKVTSNNGCVDSISKTFTVNGSFPIADFEVLNSTSLCSNREVVIQNKSTVNPGNITKVEIFWDYLNNPTLKETDDVPFFNKTYSHLYPDFQQPLSKPFQIRLVAYSGASCTGEEFYDITVNASPKTAFITIPGICLDAAPRQITQASEVGGVPKAQDIFSSTTPAISNTGVFDPSVAGAGTYTIQYLYISPAGCRDSSTSSITVWPAAEAKFGVSDPVCERSPVTFTDTSVANIGNITTWNWNFGDGNIVPRNTAAAFTHTYNTPNIYMVSLSITTDSGCTSLPQTKNLKVNYRPVVNFDMPSICLPEGRGTFNDLSTIADGTASMFSYLWNFGDPSDPNPSTLKNPIHKYSDLGPYEVKLKVTSSEGCVDSLIQTMGSIYPQPKADFSVNPNEVCIGDAFNFTDHSQPTGSNAEVINEWHWNFGDGSSPSQIKNPTYTYANDSTYEVSLYVFNNRGCVSDTAVKNITVHPYPVVSSPDVFVLSDGFIILNPTVIGSDLSYQWTPGQYLDNPAIRNPKYTPGVDQTYRLTVTGIGGCVSFDDLSVKVLKSPVIPNAFSPNNDGINDTWNILYLDSYPGCTIEVFDRFGRRMFYSQGYDKPWNGTLNGKEIPIGVYYYIINPKNGRKPMSGSVMILK